MVRRSEKEIAVIESAGTSGDAVQPLICAFCGVNQSDVALLLKGDFGACICPACVELARDLIGASRLGVLPENGPGSRE